MQERVGSWLRGKVRSVMRLAGCLTEGTCHVHPRLSTRLMPLLSNAGICKFIRHIVYISCRQCGMASIYTVVSGTSTLLCRSLVLERLSQFEYGLSAALCRRRIQRTGEDSVPL